jgi:hypothetical protein
MTTPGNVKVLKSLLRNLPGLANRQRKESDLVTLDKDKKFLLGLTKEDLTGLTELDPLSPGLIERHPGWWFGGDFDKLTTSEKEAWLELLTLGVASYGGLIAFCSIKQLSAWLDIGEANLAFVLKKALDRWMIELREMVLIPVSGRSLPLHRIAQGELPPSALKLIEKKSHKVVRFYLLTFPGCYSYNTGPLEQKISESWEQETGYDRIDKSALAVNLKEPCELLQRRLSRDKLNEYRTQIVVENPQGNTAIIRLPLEASYYIGSRKAVAQRLTRKTWRLMPISHSDAATAAVRLCLARFKMMSRFSQYLGKKDLGAAITGGGRC